MANRRKHEKSPQEIYQAKFAATQRRRDHENALAAHVSLRRISDRTDYLQVSTLVSEYVSKCS